MKQFIVNVKNESGFELPRYKTQGSAGMDLYANIEKPVWIWPLCRKKIPTGLKIQLGNFMMADVRSRSGLASKHGIAVDSGVGTVDSDYRGEIFVPLANHSWWPFKIKPGMRIAQLIISSYKRIEWNPVERLDNTERGEGGFGSTGV